jgi:hypothetical protein
MIQILWIKSWGKSLTFLKEFVRIKVQRKEVN